MRRTRSRITIKSRRMSMCRSKIRVGVGGEGVRVYVGVK